MDPSSNFYNYRTALRGAAQRSLTAHSSREKVCVYRHSGHGRVAMHCTETQCELLGWAAFTCSNLRKLIRCGNCIARRIGKGSAKGKLDCGKGKSNLV